MVEKETIGQGPSSTPGHQGQQQEAGYWDDHASLVADGFQHSLGLPDLGAHIDAPPAYGDQHDQLQLSQAGIEAGANVTHDGRVNISINQRDRRFSEILGPAFRNQLFDASLPAPKPPPPYVPEGLAGIPGEERPPRLNVVIQIVGSRGDVQPFVALGEVLREQYGHRVRLATHATFQKFVEENGLEFFNIGGDPAELMAFMVKNPGLMPGFDALRSGEVTKRRKGIEEILLGCWRSCIEAGDGLGPPAVAHAGRSDAGRDDVPPEPTGSASWPATPLTRPFVADVIIANPPSFAHIHIAEKMGIPLHMMFTMPWTPTRAFPHPLANIQSSNTDEVMTNYLSYALVEMMTWQGLGDVINRFRTKVLDLEPLSLIWAPGLLTRLRIPTTYCWSPALIPKPHDWGTHIDISGFFFLNLASSYTPDPELAAFLDAGPPPVYIGFGSIVVDDPNALTRLIFDAVSLAGVRALVSKGWGGLGADSVGIPDGVFMLGNVPHDWLFTKVACVVHHGGAGTTAAGINLGVPTIVVPFFGDQPFWGSMVHRAGAGPAPIPHKKLTAENLAQAIREALKPETQQRARELGARIRSEDGTAVAARAFHAHLQLDSLRCHLSPSRPAVWRVRRTKIRLSTFAAAVLVTQGELQYSDLKLYRAKEHTTEDQPWDPISAASLSLLADIGAITMSIADIPRDIIKSAAIHRRGASGSVTPVVGAHDGTGSATPVVGAAPGGAEHNTQEPRADEASSVSSAPSTATRTASAPDPLVTSSSSVSSMTDTAASSTPIVTSPGAMSPRPDHGNSSVTSDSHENHRHSLRLPLHRATCCSRSTSRDRLHKDRPDSDGAATAGTITPSTTATTAASGPDVVLGSTNASSASLASRSTLTTPSVGQQSSGSTEGGASGRVKEPAPEQQRHEKQSVSINFESAMEASRGVGRIVETGIKSPMNFTMGLARGFRNAPKLYNDDTVRPIEKVTDFTSGLKIAGKEFGYGFYDGLSGLVTQPLRGAEKEGAVGLIKGVGKGIGGLVLKPAAGIWSLPAYTLAGVHAEVRNLFSRSAKTHILRSRVAQGLEEYYVSTPPERDEVIARWKRSRMEGEELRPFYSLKNNSSGSCRPGERSMTIISSSSRGRSRPTTPTASDHDAGSSEDEWESGPSPPKTGWFHTRHLSIDERRRLHQKKDAWKRRQKESKEAAKRAAAPPPGYINLSAEDMEFERAIQASIRETSCGDADDDARVEAAVRASVAEVRRRMAESRDGSRQHAAPQPERSGSGLHGPSSLSPHTASGGGHRSASHPVWSTADEISDEEYQAYIAEAIQQSLHEQAIRDAERRQLAAMAVTQPSATMVAGAGARGSPQPTAPPRRPPEAAPASTLGGGADDEDDPDLRAALEASRTESYPTRPRNDLDDEEQAQLLRAIEESTRTQEEAARAAVGAAADHDEEQAQLLRAIEESTRTQQEAARAAAGAEADDEEELRRALEASRAEHDEHVSRCTAEEERALEEALAASLADEEARQRQWQRRTGAGPAVQDQDGKGKAREVGGDEEDGEEDEDEELRRAVALSLQSYGKGGAAHELAEGEEEGEGSKQHQGKS